MPTPSDHVETLRAEFRRHMPVVERWAYFDHAAVAPLPDVTATAVAEWARQAAADGATGWRDWSAQVEATRRTAAAILNAAPEEIALVPNTTMGITLIAEGLDWQQGENAVVLADEFPSNIYPWMNLASRGVEMRKLETQRGRLDLGALAQATDARTRVVSLSWVGYATGYRQPLSDIAQLVHRRGALLLVDAIQGLGAFPLDVKQTDIDFLAADGHKWMLAPEGAGIAYIRQELLERLRPLGVGWNSVVHSFDYSRHELRLKDAAERYEGGSCNMPGMIGLGASLKLLSELGIERIAAATLDITDRACRQIAEAGGKIASRRNLEPNGHDPRSGIVSFEWPGADPLAMVRHCQEQGVVLRCRDGRLRISPHGYNNEDDLARLIAALASFPR